MRPSTRVLALALSALSLLVLAPRARAEWPHDFHAPLPVLSNGAAHQSVEVALADGNGGAFLILTDDRSGTRLLALHQLPSGALDPAWPVGGVVVQSGIALANNVRAIPDRLGGFWVSWIDARTGTDFNYYSRVLPSGVFAAGFSTNGVNPLVATAKQSPSAMAADADGSLYVAYAFDFSPTDLDLNSAHFSASGTILWQALVAGSSANEKNPDIALEANPARNAIDVVFSSATTSAFAMLSRANGLTLTTQTFNATGDPNMSPQIADDGQGGMVAIYSEFGIGGYAAAEAHLRDGALPLIPAKVTIAHTGTPILSNAVNTGSGQVWYTLRWANDEAYLRSTTHLGVGPDFPMGPVGAKNSAIAVSDGQGGALAASASAYSIDTRVFSTRRNLNGAEPAFWGDGIFTLQTATSVTLTAACSDGNAGMYVYGHENSLTPQPAVAMHMDRWGTYDASPTITSIKDIANDQGGAVRVTWKASYLDRDLDAEIASYRVWRQVPVAGVASSRTRAIYDPMAAAEPEPGTLWQPDSSPNATAATFAWEFVATVPAAQFPQYSYTATTVADSSSGSSANTVYMIESRGTTFPVGWPSLPDSGHSVDNIPPATPSPFAGAVVAGANTQLTWGPNTESDLAGYELYRGATADFVPSAGNLFAKPDQTITSFFDTAIGFFYKLAAVDSHGNRSGFAALSPAGVLDAGDNAPHELAFALASSNPAIGGATLRYAMPSAGRVRVQLLDVNGRIVRTLLDASVAAGTYTARWDGRDAGGARSAAGMYFARLTAGERTITRRIVLAE